ncbi:MAG: integron integrase [Gammaproteobacteria bacterium]|nr:integron integrase [Gammaproteobacteria bacterium]
MSTKQNRIPEGSVYHPKSPRLMDQVSETMRYYHYSRSSINTYSKWIRAYIKFNNTRHPKEMGKPEIDRFLSHLAINRNNSVSTQNLALNAIVFLYKHVLHLPVSEELTPVRSVKPTRLPVVLSQEEAQALLEQLQSTWGLVARVMYGGGLRQNEALKLRVQDIDFGNHLLMIRNGKGGKDRTTLLAPSLVEPVRQHLQKVRILFEEDLKNNQANVWLPDALARKYPRAPMSWDWQWIFPSANLSADPETGEIRRHHVHKTGLGKALRKAKQQAGINKRVTSHTLRHSFATHLLQSGTNIRVVQKLMGHADVKTTEVYTHVLEQNINAVTSPLENLNL